MLFKTGSQQLIRHNVLKNSGAADLGFRIFSRGGEEEEKEGGMGRIFKKISNFVDLFFRSAKLVFRALQSTKKSLFWPKFLRRRQNFEKKQAKKASLGLFFGNFLRKNRVPP